MNSKAVAALLVAWFSSSQFFAILKHATTTRAQCCTMLAFSFLFLDHGACASALILTIAYNIVLPLAWWSFRQYFDLLLVALCNRVYWYVKVIAVLSWSLLLCTMRRDATPMAVAHMILCLLYVYCVGKELLSWLRGKLLAYYSLVSRVAGAFMLCCAVPLIHSTPAAMLHLGCSVVYACWVWRGAIALLQVYLQAWVNQVARAAAANVATGLGVLLFLWYLMLPSGSMNAFLSFVVVGKIAWACCIILSPHVVVWHQATRRVVTVCGVALASRCSEIPYNVASTQMTWVLFRDNLVQPVRSSIRGLAQRMRQLNPARDTLNLVPSYHAINVFFLRVCRLMDLRRFADSGNKNNSPTVRRSPRLAAKPRVNYRGM